jgi:type II secretory pathway component PulC
MSVKYIFSTFLLLFVIALLGVRNYEVWTQPVEVAAENGPTKKQRKDSQAAPMVMESKRDPNSIASYILIAEKNIFNPERKDFPVAPVEQNKAKVRPQVILHGVTIAGDFQVASITNPGRPLRKGERETMTLKIGQKIGEYNLAKILPDRITMESNGDSFEVLLYDSKNPKKRTEVKTEVKPGTVMTTQPAPASPSSPAAASATAPAPAPAGKVLPAAIVEKPKEPPQQPIAPPVPTPTPRNIPPQFQPRRGAPAYPPTSPPTGLPGQTTQ